MKKSLFVLLLCCGCGKKQEAPKARVPNVVTAVAVKATVPRVINAVGNVRAYNSAQMKARVEGYLVDVHFKEGEVVKEGDLLFTIDPDPYIAALEEAEAQLRKDEATLAYNRDRLDRFTPLVEEEFVSQLDYDNYATAVATAEAQVLEDMANVEKAKINLDYCYIRAPFNATASRRLVDLGNLIGNDGQDLLLLNQVRPIYADISVPEKYVIPMLERQQRAPLEVHIQPPGTEKIFKGEVIVIGNQINKQTGMVPVRTVFHNEEMLLWPGQFTKAHVILDYVKDAVMVPEMAVNLGQKGHYVFVVKGGKAVVHKVEVGLQHGSTMQILSGIEPGDEVIIDGQISVRPNEEVHVKGVNKVWARGIEDEKF